MPNELLRELQETLDSLDVPARIVRGELIVDEQRRSVEILERAHPTPAELARLVTNQEVDLQVVVADRLSAAAKQTLRDQGFGWIDRRGHARVWASGVRIDTTFPSPAGVATRAAPTRFTPAVREVAFAILMEPTQRPSPRRLGGMLHRSPGYVSTILTGLAENGLLDDDGRALIPELFWALSSAWPAEWTYLDDDPSVITSRVDTLTSGPHAALAWGAPLLSGADETVHLVLADKHSIRTVLNTARVSARPSRARSAIQAVGPIFRLAWVDAERGRLAHPLLTALDLSVDARGRESIGSWRANDPVLGLVATLEVFEHTGWIQENWIEQLLSRSLSDEMWGAAARACWSNEPEGLAVIFQHRDTPSAIRKAVRHRLDEYIARGEYQFKRVLRFAPSLAAEKRYHLTLDTLSPTDRADDRIRCQIALGFSEGSPRGAIRSGAAAILNGEVKSDSWAQASLAHYLLRLSDIGDLLSHDVEALEEMIEVPQDEPEFKWTEWTSGPDPLWKALTDRVKETASVSRSARRQLLQSILGEDLASQAVPLVELLRHADPDELPSILQPIENAAQAINDLHIRAKVLAEASTFADDSSRSGFLDSATTAGRAAVYQTASSLLAGPDAGGIRGLLEVVTKLRGSRREDLLAEITEHWLGWLNPANVKHQNDKRRRDRRMMFHHGGDDTLPLVRLLTTAGMTDELQQVFEAIRATGAEHGNVLEGYLSMGAWPALSEGDLEMAGLYVDQARRPSAWSLEHRELNDEASTPPDGAVFPDHLVGYRNAWR